MKLDLVFSSHALEQFISRSDPSMTHAEAEEILRKEMEFATWLKEKTRTGERYLYFPTIDYCLIVKRDGRDLIAVTCVKSEHQVPQVPASLLALDTYSPANQVTTDERERKVRFAVEIDYDLLDQPLEQEQEFLECLTNMLHNVGAPLPKKVRKVEITNIAVMKYKA